MQEDKEEDGLEEDDALLDEEDASDDESDLSMFESKKKVRVYLICV